MLRELGWESLQSRRRNIRLAMLHKIIHGLVDINKEDYIRPNDKRTRGQSRIYQERITNQSLFNSFFPRTIRDWNALPKEVVDTESLDAFRHRLQVASKRDESP
jgi:ribonuclease P/MRP protein subunit RPP40